MRIISDFKDYYDCIQAYGQDDLLYVRKKSVIRFVGREQHRYPFMTFGGLHWWYWQMPRASALTIGFAGKVYGGIAMSPGPICYSASEFEAEIGKQPKRFQTMYEKKPHKRGKSGADYVRQFFRHDFWKSDFSGHFEKAPIFVGRQDGGFGESTITYNECLRPLHFMRVLDTYQAFQELFMYLSNQAKPFRPIPEVSDKDMIIAKGFDKHSFRKAASS